LKVSFISWVLVLVEKVVSVLCSRNKVVAQLRAQARKAGANAIIVLKEKDPITWSICCQAAAERIHVE